MKILKGGKKINKSLERLTSPVILGAILLLSFSANALAARGYADSKTTAVELNESYSAGSYLDYQDTDWYKYTNNLGRTIEISFSCDPMVDFINYDLRGHILMEIFGLLRTMEQATRTLFMMLYSNQAKFFTCKS